ncbi:MAG: HlyD family efflux transporter periplasmic adaptor subunit, partial [Nannocystaceae bacterium]
VIWSLWLSFGELNVSRATEHAWLESEARARPVQALVAGRVARGQLELGRMVREGEPLLQLDDTAERMRHTEEVARREDLEHELKMARAELDVERTILESLETLATATRDTAVARKRTADQLAKLTGEETRRIRRLEELSAIAELSALEQEAKHERARGEASVRGAEVRRSSASLRVELDERRARIQHLDHEAHKLAAKIRASDLTIARLAHEIERFVIRAPTSGRIAEAAVVAEGSLLEAGQHLGTIVPDGALRAVAEFPPQQVVGLVAVGQPVRLRLDAYPWMHEGAIEGTVTAVASIPTGDRVRVEIRIDRAPSVPLQHGLTGVAEVHVQTTTPFRLVMRSAGDLLSEVGPGPNPAPRED